MISAAELRPGEHVLEIGYAYISISISISTYLPTYLPTYLSIYLIYIYIHIGLTAMISAAQLRPGEHVLEIVLGRGVRVHP